MGLIVFFCAVTLLMIAGVISRIAETPEIIRDQKGNPYLIRYFIVPRVKGWGRLYLHHIVASDPDRALHDHPWHYQSLVLLGGYWEQGDIRQIPDNDVGWESAGFGEERKWFGPGSWIDRGAGWRHRLIVPTGKTAWTLFFTSKKVREWGFYPNDSFCHHRKYDGLTGLCRED